MSKIQDEIVLDCPLDMHVHFRQDEMLKIVAPITADSFAGALIMPNTVPAVKTRTELLNYKKSVEEACNGARFQPYFTLFMHEAMGDPKFFADFQPDDFLAIKLYPDYDNQQITTNSSGGINPEGYLCLEILKNCQERNIPVCVHGETNGFVMDREKEFCAIYEKWATDYPNLKIIMEHITTADSAKLLEKHANLYATVTLHHLMITMDDWAGEKLRPHLFCKPVAKRPKDRQALRNLVFGGNPKVMLGTDSAPHPQSNKECAGCAAGVFTAPVTLQVLTEQFFKANASLENLQSFISWNARRIYQISPPNRKFKLVRKKGETSRVPDRFGEVIPFLAGCELPWTRVEIKCPELTVKSTEYLQTLPSNISHVSPPPLSRGDVIYVAHNAKTADGLNKPVGFGFREIDQKEIEKRI